MSSKPRVDFEPVTLPDEMKQDLCRDILAEFGVERIKRSGTEFLMHCVMPWHEDRRIGSAFLSWKKLTYICFSCQSSGGLLWLLGVLRGGTEDDTRKWLEERTGLSGDYDVAAMMRYLDSVYAETDRAPAPMPKFSPRALERWAFIHPWLTDPISEGGRGIPEANLEQMQVGYAEEYPMGKDAEDNPLPPSERIVVPHFWRGALVGWQSRRLDPTDGTPKWLSTPEMPKDRTLYNHREDRDYAVVVESPMSTLRHLHHQPFTATFGALVTDNQVRLLAQYPKVVLWMDPDEAGWRATRGWTDDSGEYHPGLLERLERYTDVWAVETDWAVDPGDMDDQTVDDLIAEAVPSSLWEEPEVLRCWWCKRYHVDECKEEVN